MNFKVGDQIIVKRDFAITKKGSIGVINKIDDNLFFVEFSVIINDYDFRKLNREYSVTADGVRKLTKLDKALK